MSPDETTAGALRAAAARMVAATEYFKSAGTLPPWARDELESWGDGEDPGAEVDGPPTRRFRSSAERSSVPDR